MAKKRDYSIKGNQASHKGRNIVVGLLLVISLIAIYFIRINKNNENTISNPKPTWTSKESNILTVPDQPSTKPTTNGTSEDNSTIVGTLGTGTTKDISPADQDLYIYLDGWSRSLLPGDAKIYDAATGEEASASFLPLNEKDIKSSLAKAPEVLSTMLARLYATDYKFSCSANGCADSRGVVPAEKYLSSPSLIPTLGKIYTAYGIDHALYLAKFKVHSKTGLLSLTIGNSNRYAIDAVGKIVPSGFADQSTIMVGPENGYGKRTFGFSAGLGRIFLTQPSWIGNSPLLFNYQPYGVQDYSAPSLNANKSMPLQLGLADFSAASLVNGLNDSQLTFYTSPSTGCGSFVLCLPGNIKPTISNLKTNSFTLCTKVGTKATAEVYNAELNLTLPKPVLLNGILKTPIPDFTGKIASILDNPLPVDLQEGKLTYSQRAILLYTNGELNYIVSQRSISSLPTWGSKEVTSYLGSGFTICN